MTDAVVLHQRVAPGASDAVRELVAERVASEDVGGTDTGVDALVGFDGVHTASLFLGRRDGGSRLVWYLEVDDAERGPWADPATAPIRNSPLFDAGLGDRLEAPDSARVLSAPSTATALVVHATLPGRPSSAGTDADGTPRRVLVPSEAFDGRSPDVVLLRLRVAPGLGELFVRALAGATGRLDDEGRIERAFDDWTEPVLEDEGMLTETVFLERTEGDYYLCWYMEAEDTDEVYEAYFGTSNRVARISEHVVGWILENPRRVLQNPVESSDHELLAHAVSPDRP